MNMPQLIYALDSAIDSFFAEAGSASSREECDQFASQQFGGTIQPVSIQGLSSYTVIAGSDSDKIIQFREQAALLDMKMLAIAKHVHKDLVPDCSAVGWIGKNNSQPLAIYEMNRLPGENYITIRASLTSDQQRNTIYSLAKYGILYRCLLLLGTLLTKKTVQLFRPILAEMLKFKCS
jgi:hypothetical protein